MAFNVPTLAEMNAKPRAEQKGLPRVLVKQDRKAEREAIEEAFREGVWRRDAGKSRASGRKLSRGAKGWDQRGEVHHPEKRSTHPEGKFEISRGILLSKTEHALAGTRCPKAVEFFMLDILPTVKGATRDLGLPQVFIWRDVEGNVLKRRLG